MDLREAIRNQTDVSLSFAKHLLLKAGEDNNLVLSPLSIHVVLSLIAAGSNGSTRDQLLSFLKSNSTDHLNSFASQLVALVFTDGSLSGGPRLRFANGVWLDQSFPLKPSFKQIVNSDYKAALSQVDFKTKAVQVTQEINSWVEKETSGLIEEVFAAGSLDNASRLVFANALYFKGAWNEKFKASATKKYDFHLGNGSSVKAPFMTSKERQFIRACDGFKVLGLPYKQGEDKRRFTMYFLLPDANDGLPALIERVGSLSGFLDRCLPHTKVRVGDFRIPKFKISCGVEISNVLKELGLTLPFFEEGELTEMVDSLAGQDLFVSKMFQKAFIEVNEEGTEAAAASVCGIELSCYQREINFVADHPFLFIVREDMSGTLLFVGKMLHPEADHSGGMSAPTQPKNAQPNSKKRARKRF